MINGLSEIKFPLGNNESWQSRDIITLITFYKISHNIGPRPKTVAESSISTLHQI